MPLLFALALFLSQPLALPYGYGCPHGVAPDYRPNSGFAVLYDRLGLQVMGMAWSCEFADPRGTGDVLQETENGLAFWRKSTNTPTWTDGDIHFAITAQSPISYIFWYGPSVDPSPDAALPQGAPENRCIYVNC